MGIALLVLLVIACNAGVIAMVVIGAICLDQDNQGNRDDWCTDRGGSIALLVVGTVLSSSMLVYRRNKRRVRGTN